MKMQVIEPSVIRLTSDETRALMRIALAPQPVTVSNGGQGIIDLGLVCKVRAKRSPKKIAQLKIVSLGRVLSQGVSYRRARLLVHEIGKLTDSIRYNRLESLYELTPAGKALVKGVTIRRK